MVLFELQHTLRVSHGSKMHHSAVHQPVVPRVPGSNWRKTKSVNKRFVTNCVAMSLFVWSQTFVEFGVPYSDTSCIISTKTISYTTNEFGFLARMGGDEKCIQSFGRIT
jgi:hypothetical protein